MRRSLIAFLPLGLLALHCSTPIEETGADEAPHTAKEPIYENAPYLWADTDYQTFRTLARAPGFRFGSPLGPDNVVTARLQAWADRIDAEVRKDVRRRTGQELVAPRPIVTIVAAKHPGAWVSGVPGCVTGEVDLSAVGKAERPAKTADLVFVENARLKEAFGMFGAPAPKCIRPSNWRDQTKLLAFVNASGSKCKLETVSGGNVRVTGEGCEVGDGAATTAKHLTYFATSPYVHMTSAIVALVNDERSAVGILAHELGHYYRSHVVSDLVMGKYNHWYEQKDPPDTTAPPPAADSGELEKAFLRIAPHPMPRVPGQKLSYRITSALTDNLGSLLQQAEICPDVTRLLDGDWRYKFDGFTGGFVDRTVREKYLAYEAALLACAPSIEVTETGGAGKLTLADVRDVIRSAAPDFSDPPVSGATLASIIGTLHERAAVVDRESDAFHDALRSRRLGRWTAEQEADEFALEYYARVALEPQTCIENYFEIAKGRNGSDPERFAAHNDGIDIQTCESLLRANWMKDGERVFVGLGDLHDPHHGDCYRVFNLSQELRAHGYRATGTAPAFTGTWAEVHAEATRVTEQYDGGDLPGGSPQLRSPASGGPHGGMIVDGL